jgi:4'-phosphopantetheinyl transferase
VIEPAPPLARDEVRVYYAESGALAREDLGAQCLSLLSEDERARHARFHFAEDRQSYLAAHALTRSVLGPLAGAPPRELRFVIGEHGKPALCAAGDGEPIEFNLSHTRGLVACAVARGRAVGVDVERIDRRVDIDQLSRSVFSEGERAELMRLAGDEKRLRFFQLWTLKEAYIKAVGRGLSLPLRAISVSFADPAQPRLAFAEPIADDGAAWWLTMRDLTKGHALAVALHAKAPVRATIEAWAWPEPAG